MKKNGRWLAVSLMTYVLAGCMTWQPVTNVRQVVAQEQPGEIRVTQADGVRSYLHSPEMRGDTIVGTDESGKERRVAAEDLVEVMAVSSYATFVGVGIGVALLSSLFVWQMKSCC